MIFYATGLVRLSHLADANCGHCHLPNFAYDLNQNGLDFGLTQQTLFGRRVRILPMLMENCWEYSFRALGE